MRDRYLTSYIREDLGEKMVFLAGPRQVGKTTLAKKLLAESGAGFYFTWDSADDRKALKKAQWPAESSLIVLDELHKYRLWKRWLKGEYDKHHERHRFLVTGSARMDVYRKGGDSLQGRYHHFRLHPFSVNEMRRHTPAIRVEKELLFDHAPEQKRLLADLMTYSGFPEPLWAQSTRTHRRWQKERVEKVAREDVRDLENIRDISLMQILVDILPPRASGRLSLNALREDMEVSHRAISRWMDILDCLYFTFRIRPYHNSKVRSLKKEAKLYLWDWSLIDQEGPRFENLMAGHLLKFCHFLEDTEGYTANLHYLRDANKREVDFLITVQGRPWFAVEAKTSDDVISPALKYFGRRFNIPWLFQVVLNGRRDFESDGVRCLPAAAFLTGLV